VEGNRLFLRKGLQSPLDDLFGRLIRTARELLLQQLLAMRCQTNGTHVLSIREVLDSSQRKGLPQQGDGLPSPGSAFIMRNAG
jgi:hypothetical protein